MTHVHGPLTNRFVVALLHGPFDGLTVEVSGCCAAPWIVYVSHTATDVHVWHPEEIAPEIQDVEQYIRDGQQHLGIVTATHFPNLIPLAGIA